MVAQVTLRLVGPVDHLRIVWQAGETLLESVPFEEDPEGTRYNVLLALQEMITNVLRHGYECEAESPYPVEVGFGVGADGVQVEIRDQGPAFDPLEHDTTAIDVLDAMPDECGGYGIYITKMVMDEVAYQREDGWNVLRMRKASTSTVAAAEPSRQGHA